MTNTFNKDKNKMEEIITNPYMGFAPPAEWGPYEQPHSMVYANFTWAELEPEKGVYDFRHIERKYKLDYWKQKNVKLIFRVVLDYPTKSQHKDIPDWLYEEIDQEGTWYDHEWGKGFSPNYAHPKLIKYHEKLISKLAERYNHDPGIAFVQLGSMGHWGEWHTLQQDGIYIPFPEIPLVETYVNHYVDSFDNKIILMRRPHQIAIENGMGLYNDMFGRHKDTVEEFWSWVQNGYTFWLTGEEFPNMKNYWQTAPTGGEFAPPKSWEEHLSSENLPDVMEQLNLTHVSWLGPSTPASYPQNGELQSGIDQVLKKIGYHFRLADHSYPKSVNAGSEFQMRMTWENSGVAPFYFPWPLEVSLADEAGEIVYKQELKTDIRNWLPGKHPVNETIAVPASLTSGTYSICVSILDPENQEPGIQFEMEGKRKDGRYTIGEIKVK
jgi:hypothetical protein